MLKLIAAFFLSSIVAVNGQAGACTIDATHQLIVDASQAINNLRAENGVGANDKSPLILFSDLSSMAAAKLTDINDTSCSTGGKYGFVTTATCCPSDMTTDRHKCVRDTEGEKFGGVPGDTFAQIGIITLTAPLSDANMVEELTKATALGTDAHFLLDNGGTQLTGLSIVTKDSDIVFIATSYDESHFSECSPGTPSSSTTTTAAPGGTTTTAAGGTTTTGTGMANSTTMMTTTRPSGASHVGVGIATLSAVAMCTA